MNWLMCIIILQVLVSRVLSDLVCLSNEKCKCMQHGYEDEIEVECGSSTLKATVMDSTIVIRCESDEILQWDQQFGQMNFTNLIFNKCQLSGITGVRHYVISTLGINEVQSLRLYAIKLNGSLDNAFLSNLETMKTLDISNTKLMLTNESFKGTPNLIKLFLRGNYIEELPKGVFKHLNHLKVLDLGGNKITNIESDLFDGISLTGLHLYSNYLTTLNLDLQSLKHLDVSNNRLSYITFEHLNSLVNLSLNKNVLIKMQDDTFINTSVEEIRFNNGNFTTIPHRFLTNLDRLHTVYLKSLNIEKVPEDMIWNSPNITKLSLASNSLTEIPIHFFRDAGNMTFLDLSGNQIENINHELLKPLIKLETLDLSNNLIMHINALKYLKNLENLNLEINRITNFKQKPFNVPKLKTLNLAHNKLNSLTFNSIFLLQHVVEVENIDLSNNHINCIDPDWLNLIKLKNINLARNNFTVLSLQEFQYIVGNVKIDLYSNPLEVIDLTDLEEIAKAQTPTHSLSSKRQIYLSSDKFFCDCRNYEFARLLHNQMPPFVHKYLQVETNLMCNDGLHTEFSNLNMDSLVCDWEIFNDVDKIDCFKECKCTYRPQDKSALMDCSNKNLTYAPEKIISSTMLNYTELNLRNNSITKLPNYENVNIKKLNIGYNNLNTINITQLPKQLTELHLDHNNLTIIGEADDLNNTLTSIKILTMRSNPWTCDCDAKDTFNFIHKYSSKITDLLNTTCHQSPTKLYTLTTLEVCEEKTNAATIVAVFMFLALFCLTFVLLRLLLNNYNLKVWLYSHNITWLISEEFLDQDKKYDAFLSYTHKDEDLVAKHLLPGLEQGTPKFKICLHSRDWIPGEFISDQIACSVHESRKTIIVLSRHFVDSVWGRTEFRTAYTNAINERRSRIIVILYGDLLIKDLDLELKTYLSTNTYIKWGDSWFWEKLRYALRRRPETKHKVMTEIVVPDKLNSTGLT